MAINESVLAKLYGAEAVSMQKSRYEAAVKSFEDIYGKQDNIRLFSAPGRTEVGGNHTDHNRGCVMAAAVGLDVIAVVTPCEGSVVSVKSEGFPEDVVDISDLNVKENEKTPPQHLSEALRQALRMQVLRYAASRHIQLQMY